MKTTAKTQVVCMVALLALLSSAWYFFARSPKLRESTPKTGVRIKVETPALAYIVVMLARDPAVQSELRAAAQNRLDDRSTTRWSR